MWLAEQPLQPPLSHERPGSLQSGLFLDRASVCPSANRGLEDPDRLGFALRRLGNPAGRYIG